MFSFGDPLVYVIVGRNNLQEASEGIVPRGNCRGRKLQNLPSSQGSVFSIARASGEVEVFFILEIVMR